MQIEIDNRKYCLTCELEGGNNMEAETKPGMEFKPFRVIFEINTKEGAIRFHDEIAIKMKSTHKLIKEVYNRIHKSDPSNETTFHIVM